jgi:hypothetical protein
MLFCFEVERSIRESSVSISGAGIRASAPISPRMGAARDSGSPEVSITSDIVLEKSWPKGR